MKAYTFSEISSIPLEVYTTLAADVRASKFTLLLCKNLCPGKEILSTLWDTIKIKLICCN
jgi:hypothetical protein